MRAGAPAATSEAGRHSRRRAVVAARVAAEESPETDSLALAPLGRRVPPERQVLFWPARRQGLEPPPPPPLVPLALPPGPQLPLVLRTPLQRSAREHRPR
jgi:hypothetical protein